MKIRLPVFVLLVTLGIVVLPGLINSVGICIYPMRNLHWRNGAYGILQEQELVDSQGVVCGDLYYFDGHYRASAYGRETSFLTGYGPGKNFPDKPSALAYVHKYCKE